MKAGLRRWEPAGSPGTLTECVTGLAEGDGVRGSRLWAKMLGIGSGTVIEQVIWEEIPAGLPDGGQVIVTAHVRLHARRALRCGVCGRRSPGYDKGEGRRRWRALDLGTIRAEIEADAPRVQCREHGAVVARVPWARHGAWHTRGFEDTVAWLACVTSRTTITQLMRISWRTAGSMIERVSADGRAARDQLAGLRRIGIDEISYRKGFKYLIVVVDHDTGRLVWAGPGRDKATVCKFFDALGEERSALLTHVSADGARWISGAVSERAPQAVQCTDPFHVVSWATEALDEVRRDVWNHARAGQAPSGRVRKSGRAAGDARDLKNARYALWKNPGDLTANQAAQLDWIAKTHPYLYRAWLLKEGIRVIFKLKGHPVLAGRALDRWLAWAARSRIPQYIELGRKIREHRPGIEAALRHSLSNGLIESVNTKLRAITRAAFGFHGPGPLIALGMLALGGLRPTLPGR
jgi:transposase